MNEQLLKFIEFCLVDGVISDKEREIIFRKAKELGVPNDECEIILEGMVGKSDSIKSQPKISDDNVSNSSPITIDVSPTSDSLDFLKDFYKKIEEIKGNLHSEVDEKKSEKDKLNLSKIDIEDKFNTLVSFLDSNSGEYTSSGLRLRKIKSSKRLMDICGIKFYELAPYIDDSIAYFDENKLWFDTRNNFFISLNLNEDAGGTVRVWHHLSENIYKYVWTIQKIKKWNPKVYINKKLFSTQASIQIDDMYFIINEEGGNAQSFYSKVKSKHDSIDFITFNELKDTIEESTNRINELEHQLFNLEQFNQFINDNEQIIYDLLRSSIISQILSSNNKELSHIDSNIISNLTKLENHILKKRKIILDNLILINDYVITDYIQELIDLIINAVNELNCIFFHSINMFNSIIKDDMLTYNRIYQKLDEFQVFNSVWENNLNMKLSDLNANIENVNERLEIVNQNVTQVGVTVVQGLKQIEYASNRGFSELGIAVKSVNESINFNNLLTGVQVYQNYKLNKRLP